MKQKKEYKILLIEDKKLDAVGFIRDLESKLPNIFVYWVNRLAFAKEILGSGAYNFDIVISDVMGVAASDFNKEIEEIEHPNLVVASGVVIPMNRALTFIDKLDLASYVVGYYSSN